jgi:hypothetical protein
MRHWSDWSRNCARTSGTACAHRRAFADSSWIGHSCACSSWKRVGTSDAYRAARRLSGRGRDPMNTQRQGPSNAPFSGQLVQTLRFDPSTRPTSNEPSTADGDEPRTAVRQAPPRDVGQDTLVGLQPEPVPACIELRPIIDIGEFGDAEPEPASVAAPRQRRSRRFALVRLALAVEIVAVTGLILAATAVMLRGSRDNGVLPSAYLTAQSAVAARCPTALSSKDAEVRPESKPTDVPCVVASGSTTQPAANKLSPAARKTNNSSVNDRRSFGVETPRYTVSSPLAQHPPTPRQERPSAAIPPNGPRARDPMSLRR